MITIVNQDEITLKTNFFTGTERVYINGNLESKKWSFAGSSHKIEIDGRCYEIDTGMKWHSLSRFAIIRQNGTIIFTSR